MASCRFSFSGLLGLLWKLVLKDKFISDFPYTELPCLPCVFAGGCPKIVELVR